MMLLMVNNFVITLSKPLVRLLASDMTTKKDRAVHSILSSTTPIRRLYHIHIRFSLLTLHHHKPKNMLHHFYKYH